MSADPLLPRVRALAESITSVAQLELLIFMHGQRARTWRADEASAELRSNPVWVRSQLEELAGRGLLVRDGSTYRLSADPEVESSVGDLAHAYRVFPVTVVGAIYPARGTPQGTNDQQNGRDLKRFADAFRLRRGRAADSTGAQASGTPPEGPPPRLEKPGERASHVEPPSPATGRSNVEPAPQDSPSALHTGGEGGHG